MAILTDEVRAVGEFAAGKSLVPLTGKLSGVVEADTGRLRENQSGLLFQAAATSAGVFLQAFDDLTIQTTYQYPSHDVFSMLVLS